MGGWKSKRWDLDLKNERPFSKLFDVCEQNACCARVKYFFTFVLNLKDHVFELKMKFLQRIDVLKLHYLKFNLMEIVEVLQFSNKNLE